jgi:hypothetical protein
VAVALQRGKRKAEIYPKRCFDNFERKSKFFRTLAVVELRGSIQADAKRLLIMPNWIRLLPEQLARWRVVAILAVPTLVLLSIFNFHPAAVPALLQAGKGTPPLDMQLGYGPQGVHSLLTTYGSDGRQRYVIFLVADLVYAVCYGLLLTGLLRLALRPPVTAPGSRWNYLCWVPLLAGAADCVENLCILTLLSIYPAVPAVLTYTASSATLAKWSLAAVGILAIIVAFGIRLALSSRLAAGPIHIQGDPGHEAAR